MRREEKKENTEHCKLNTKAVQMGTVKALLERATISFVLTLLERALQQTKENHCCPFHVSSGLEISLQSRP